MLRYVGILASLLVLLVLLGVGCRQKETKKLPKVDVKFYQSIISLSPSATEVISQYANLNFLKGRTASCNFPVSVKKIDVVMSGIKPDYEKIMSLKPDLIVYDPHLFNESDIAKLKELKIDLFPFECQTIDEFENTLYRFATMMHSETNTSEYVDKINASISSASAGRENKPKVAVLMPGDGGEHMIAGLHTLQADIVNASGGQTVGPNEKMFTTLNVESLIGMNPDVIVVAGESDSIINDSRLKSIKAIKDNRVIAVKQDIILRAGIRLDILINELAKRL